MICLAILTALITTLRYHTNDNNNKNKNPLLIPLYYTMIELKKKKKILESH